MLGLIVLPMLKMKKPAKPVYKKPSTDDACYAINDQGYLEQINTTSRQFID